MPSFPRNRWPISAAATKPSFKELWKQHYGFGWQPQNSSPYAHYLTGQLKGQLYWDLERQLLEHVRNSPQAKQRRIAFVVPIHSLYSNIAAGLTAPLGTSCSLDGIDGYIGQIWTGPVRWASANYGSEEKSFFTSAYALYDYFPATDRRVGQEALAAGRSGRG